MRVACRRVLVLVLVLGLAGCAGTAETHYFMLSAVSPEPTRTSPAAPSISITTVTLPGVLDRPQIVRASSANTVEVREFDRWAEPLDQMVRRRLREDVARLSTGRRGHVARVAVAIDEFMAHADGTAGLAGQWWWVADTDSAQPASRRPFQFSTATGSADMSSMASALSRLLGRLAADIAGAERT